MITFDDEQQVWSIENRNFLYKVGLKQNRCHHIAFLPIEYKEKMDIPWIQNRNLRPEAQVNINFEGSKIAGSGIRNIGFGAGMRAEYSGYEINDDPWGQTLSIISMDRRSDLEIRNIYIAYKDSNAIRRYTVLKNLGQSTIKVNHLDSFCLYGVPWASTEAFQKDMLLYL